jgi:glucosyl-3-phosphoglycerate synthase
MIPRFDHTDFSAAGLLEAKVERDLTITVALPAKDEAKTIGPIIELIRNELIDQHPLVDELIVIDDQSVDNTAAIASDAGATVLGSNSILSERVMGSGKGEALWKSLYASSGDLICWCDADIGNYANRFILGPLGPLLIDQSIGFVKGFYRRPLPDDGEGGGRTTELMARPLIASLFPALSGLVQPLSGEFAGRRELLEQIPFSRGYAVDMALLVDLTERFGTGIMAQVNLGSRIHRNRPLRDLGPQSAAILGMALRRAGLDDIPDRLQLVRPQMGDAEVPVGDLPPIASLR